MSREAYVELVQDLCDELELGEAGQLLDQGVLLVDDTLIGLEYLEERDEVRLLMDLGEIVPDVDRADVAELLLQANLVNTSFCLPTFSLHPETGHPFVAYHVPLEALVDEEIDLAFVLTQQLIPLLEDWNAMMRGVFDADVAAAEGASLHLPSTLA